MVKNISSVIFMLAGAGLSQRTAFNFTTRKREHSVDTDIHMLIWTHTASHYLLNIQYNFPTVKLQTIELLHKTILLHYYCLNLHLCKTELRYKMTSELPFHMFELRRMMPWERRHRNIRAFSVSFSVSSPPSPKLNHHKLQNQQNTNDY